MGARKQDLHDLAHAKEKQADVYSSLIFFLNKGQMSAAGCYSDNSYTKWKEVQFFPLQA